MDKLRFNHPFINGLKEVPENHTKDMQKIQNWISTQPHLPQISDDFVYLFLHACYYNLDKTKSAIENYFTIRANSPAVFHNRDAKSKGIQDVAKLGRLLRLPKPTPEGYTVLLYGIKDTDPTKLVFADAIKGFCMYNDCILSEDGLAEGYVVLFDMKGLQIGHLARVSLPVLRTFMLYIQEAHPCRLKAIHIINTSSWIHHIMRIIVPLVKTELMSLIKFHKGVVPDGIPQELLPKDFGGEAPSLDELENETHEKLIPKYHEWLIETEYFRADESKRIKKVSWWGLLTGSNHNNNNNNNKKNFDEEILKNLQID